MELNNCFNSATCTSMTAHLGGSGSPAECLLPSCSKPSIIVGVYGHSTAYAPAFPCSDAFHQKTCGLNCARFHAETPGVYWGWHSRKQISCLCSLPLVPFSKQSRNLR